MSVTVTEALEMLARGETEEAYRKRIARLRRLANKRDALLDAIEILDGDPRAAKKQKRLQVVMDSIGRLK